jgi:two-component system CheB/CheR fusion protein
VTANRDLYATTSDLRSSNDELLVANEEAQAATEEVETLNEELQATNEELETLNEELQATIEELNTTNDDLEARTIELQDTAARLESARAASETERARLAAILESMGDAVVVVDRQARPLLANDAYTRLVGPASHTTMDDEQGRPIRGAASLEARAARGEEFETVVTRATKAGGRRWYEAVSCRVQSVTVPESTLLVVRDITDRSLRRLQDEFIANASHELRTPLAVLTGYLHLIDRAATDRVAGHVRRALDHARELDHLVGDLLDITRLETGRLRYEPEPLDLADLVHQAVDAAVVVASEQRIGFRRPARPLIVDADRTRLLQVVRNLLDNARVHAPGAEVRVALRRRSGRAELSVSDDGPGIAANEASKVFERFQQVGAGQSSQPGLGLGLHIAREIVRAHKGTINVTSPDGGGTVFTVRLPLLGERKSRPTGPKPPSRVHA